MGNFFAFIGKFFGLFIKGVTLLETALDAGQAGVDIVKNMAEDAKDAAVIDRKIARARKLAEQREAAAEFGVPIE